MDSLTRINQDVAKRLIDTYGFKVHQGAVPALRGGRCPACEKKTLWTWQNTPGLIQCDRTNHCGYSATSRELFPELFEKINKRYPATPENPNRTADAYLSIVRGLNPEHLTGWYEQGSYWQSTADKGTATVRFWLNTQKTVYWERLIEKVTLTTEDGHEERDSNFKGSFKGLWWQPPAMEINHNDTVYLTEGIFKAIALNLIGQKAVSIMSAGSFPDETFKLHQGKNVTWVLALDSDKAGREYTHKHLKKIRALKEKVVSAFTTDETEKIDWDDLYKDGKLTKKDLATFRYYGDLEIAASAREKALAIWQQDKSKLMFCTTYNNSTYSIKLDHEEFEKAKKEILATDAIKEDKAIEHAFISAAKIKEIATFTMSFLYFQQPADGEDGQYFFSLRFANKSPEAQHAFPGKIFGSAGDFKKAILQRSPGGQFIGGVHELDYLYKNWLKKQPKIVKTIDYIGYDADTKAYVYENYCVESGRVIELNSQSFFTLKKTAIKSTHAIKQQLTAKPHADFYADYRAAFGKKGLIVLAWWVGSLFAEQIRHTQRSYPFFEIYGKAGSGKSDMVDTLWKLFGRRSSTFNPNSSTLPGRTRKMSEISNMPVVFNETDNGEDAEKSHFKKFTWEEQKDLYEGEFGRVTGVKTGDNSTRLPLFRAAMMAVQNPKITGSEAILSRFVTVDFDLSHHTKQGKEASDRLNELEISQLSGFLLATIKNETAFLQRFQTVFASCNQRLQKNPNIKMQRIIQNHAQLMALVDCLALVVPIDAATINQLHDDIVLMAERKQEELNEDHQIVAQFWANFDYLNSSAPGDGGYLIDDLMNHSNDPESEIAVNLEHFNASCEKFNLPRLSNSDLRKYLCTSRSRKFKENKPIHSRLEKRTVRCFIFKQGR